MGLPPSYPVCMPTDLLTFQQSGNPIFTFMSTIYSYNMNCPECIDLLNHVACSRFHNNPAQAMCDSPSCSNTSVGPYGFELGPRPGPFAVQGGPQKTTPRNNYMPEMMKCVVLGVLITFHRLSECGKLSHGNIFHRHFDNLKAMWAI